MSIPARGVPAPLQGGPDRWPGARALPTPPAYDVSLRDEDVAPQALAPEERKPIFTGIRQALKAGGLLLLRGYRPEQLAYKTGGPSQIENLYAKAMLAAVFADFADLEISGHDSMAREEAGTPA
jgi:hypothetical protein